MATEKRLFFLLSKAHRKLFRHLDSACQQQLEVTLPQLGALLYIGKHPGCPQKAVADALDLNKSAITGLLSRMEANSLIERRLDADDARVVKVFASELGIQKARTADPLIKALNQEIGRAFSEQEMATILRFLHFILDRFE